MVGKVVYLSRFMNKNYDFEMLDLVEVVAYGFLVYMVQKYLAIKSHHHLMISN